jgi:hypothetical protein
VHTFRLRLRPKRNVVFGDDDVATTTVEGEQARGFIQKMMLMMVRLMRRSSFYVV